MRRKTFTHKFKQECVNLVIQHNSPVLRAAETMNIGLSTLQRWLRQYRGKSRGDTTLASAITYEYSDGRSAANKKVVGQYLE